MKGFWQRWKEEPKFAFRLFLLGTTIFFAGVLPLWLWAPEAKGWRLALWSLMIGGLLVALVGYIGIWRWRWREFLDK